jgi:histidine ammonia-lyase
VAALEPAPGTGAVARLLRESGIDGPGPDRHLAPEIARATELVRSGSVVAVVESMIGRLQ